jgi:hypothetical protein
MGWNATVGRVRPEKRLGYRAVFRRLLFFFLE